MIVGSAGGAPVLGLQPREAAAATPASASAVATSSASNSRGARESRIATRRTSPS